MRIVINVSNVSQRTKRGDFDDEKSCTQVYLKLRRDHPVLSCRVVRGGGNGCSLGKNVSLFPIAYAVQDVRLTVIQRKVGIESMLKIQSYKRCTIVQLAVME